MIDVGNRIFSNVEKYVHRTYQNVNCQNSATATPPDFPALSVKQIDMAEVALDMDGGYEGQSFAVDSNVEIQVYSNKSITESRQIINQACDAMRLMSYARRYGPSEIPDRNSPNLYRMVARFARIINSLEDVPKFE